VADADTEDVAVAITAEVVDAAVVDTDKDVIDPPVEVRPMEVSAAAVVDALAEDDTLTEALVAVAVAMAGAVGTE
jgi:hypothetical protein